MLVFYLDSLTDILIDCFGLLVCLHGIGIPGFIESKPDCYLL